MKIFFSLVGVSLLIFLSRVALAQTVPASLSPTPTTALLNGAHYTPTPVPRVNVNPADEDIQPPADGPSGDDMGFLGLPKGALSANETATPVNFETMQSTLTAMIPNGTPTIVPIPTLPNSITSPVTTAKVSPTVPVAK